MSIIVDGYNPLCGAGIVADSREPYSLQKSRRALLKFLCRVLQPDERSDTTVVFDAKSAPPNLPRFHDWETIRVVFAEAGQEADDVIVQLIEQHNSPRQLLVVSSDHAVQRAARRRRAKFSDSDVWFRNRIRQRQLREKAEQDITDPATVKIESLRHGPLSPQEVASWLTEFDDENPDATRSNNSGANPESLQQSEPPTWNPFPDGYGEDLLNEDF